MRKAIGSVVSTLALAISMAASAASFSYHGSLQDNGKPANGKYDLQLTLYSAAQGGKVVGGPLTLYAVPVQHGSFNTQADFGPMANVQNAWLAVNVKTAGRSQFSALGARAPVSADATVATGSVCPGAWTLAGNAGNPAGSYLGTADSNPLYFEVNGTTIGQLFTSEDSNVPDAPNVVFGSGNNDVESSAGATIAGGGRPVSYCGANGTSSCWNYVNGNYGTIGGGRGNQVYAYAGTIPGGGDNSVNENYATIGGGSKNSASGAYSAIAGGVSNNTGGNAVGATIGGGVTNSANGPYATVPGGIGNIAAGTSSFAAGQYAQANHAGSFVWSDATGSAATPFASSATDQFLIKASGGVGIGTNAPEPSVQVDVETGDQIGILAQNNSISHQTIYAYNTGGGTALFVGSKSPTQLVITTSTGADLTEGGVWENASDRNLKRGFQAVDVGHILSEVVAMPVTRWFYKTEGDAIHHIGPVAQDFYAAFGLGRSDKTIGTVDEGGVALAAIQGLNQKVEKENVALKSENATLKAEINAIRARLDKIDGRK